MVIKRYRNRKLYNTVTLRRVTLEELVDLIQSGKEVQVLDQATGRDLTSQMALAKKEEAQPTEVAKRKLVEIIRETPPRAEPEPLTPATVTS